MHTLPIRALILLGALAACGDTPAGLPPDPCREALVGYPPQETQAGAIRHVHDPEIVKGEDGYYVLSTNDGVPIRRSTDLIRWELLGRVFENPPYPEWAPTKVPGVGGVWAPGVGYFNGQYHLYYSLSTFGSPRSVIGLVTSPTLDPREPSYAWVDHGEVVESFGWYPANAIDAAVVEDYEGGLWLTWGSYGGGIVMRALDAATGMPSAANDSVHALARRPLEHAVEGPYMVKRDGWYYLFVSFDRCCAGIESTYNVRVGRSRVVTGPYLDREARPMMEGGGSVVLGGYGRVHGPGHASVLHDGDDYLLVHHFYDGEDNGVPHLQIRPLLWDADGWPLAGHPYRGEELGPPPAEVELVGGWGYWTGRGSAREVRLNVDGSVEACDRSGSWSYEAPMLTVEWDAPGVGGPAGTEQSVLAGDGESLVGRTPQNEIVRAYRLRGGS